MKRMIGFLGIVAGLLAPAVATAQPTPPVQHIIGRATSQQWKMDRPSQIVTDTLTLRFEGDGPAYTVDFITRHGARDPVAAAGVVDIVVTQHPVEDDKPEMTLRVDGQTVPLVARPLGMRSVVASVPLDAFVRLTNAGAIVDRTFNTELEFGEAQLRVLRSVAAQWSGKKP
jgi:hypothetical protein